MLGSPPRIALATACCEACGKRKQRRIPFRQFAPVDLDWFSEQAERWAAFYIESEGTVPTPLLEALLYHEVDWAIGPGGTGVFPSIGWLVANAISTHDYDDEQRRRLRRRRKGRVAWSSWGVSRTRVSDLIDAYLAKCQANEVFVPPRCGAPAVVVSEESEEQPSGQSETDETAESEQDPNDGPNEDPNNASGNRTNSLTDSLRPDAPERSEDLDPSSPPPSEEEKKGEHRTASADQDCEKPQCRRKHPHCSQPTETVLLLQRRWVEYCTAHGLQAPELAATARIQRALDERGAIVERALLGLLCSGAKGQRLAAWMQRNGGCAFSLEWFVNGPDANLRIAEFGAIGQVAERKLAGAQAAAPFAALAQALDLEAEDATLAAELAAALDVTEALAAVHAAEQRAWDLLSPDERARYHDRALAKIAKLGDLDGILEAEARAPLVDHEALALLRADRWPPLTDQVLWDVFQAPESGLLVLPHAEEARRHEQAQEPARLAKGIAEHWSEPDLKPEPLAMAAEEDAPQPVQPLSMGGHRNDRYDESAAWAFWRKQAPEEGANEGSATAVTCDLTTDHTVDDFSALLSHEEDPPQLEQGEGWVRSSFWGFWLPDAITEAPQAAEDASGRLDSVAANSPPLSKIAESVSTLCAALDTAERYLAGLPPLESAFMRSISRLPASKRVQRLHQLRREPLQRRLAEVRQSVELEPTPAVLAAGWAWLKTERLDDPLPDRASLDDEPEGT